MSLCQHDETVGVVHGGLLAAAGTYSSAIRCWLCTGFVPGAAMAGEASFAGQQNSLWFYRTAVARF